MSYFDDSNWTVGFIDAEFGVIELHNIYTRDKVYVPMPDGDELEAFAMNVLALMRRAHARGKEDQRGRAGAANIRLVATSTRDNTQPDS